MELDPDPLVRGTDPGIRIRANMALVPNTAEYGSEPNSLLKKVGAGIRSKYDVIYVRLIFVQSKSALTRFHLMLVKLDFSQCFGLIRTQGFDDKNWRKKFTAEKRLLYFFNQK